MGWVVVFIIILFIMGIALGYIGYGSDDGNLLCVLLSIVCFALCGAFIIKAFDYNEPTAIDVYRGKTTLQITYKDSIPVDSVVIFKEK